MDVCLYMRMSTDKQENSIESQRKVLQAYAKTHNLYIMETEYIDEGISGRKADKRPAFMQMIEDSAKGLFEAVLIYDSSRFARNLEESLVYKSILKRNNVTIISATEPTLDDDTSLMTDALLGAMNEMYSRKLSKAVKRGMNFKVEQGYFQNRTPYGYNRPVKGGIAQINEAQAEIVRLIFELFTTKMPGYLSIARELNERGITRGDNGYWLIRDVKRIINNVAYIGYIQWSNGDLSQYKGKHQPIITEELFNKAQEIVKAKPERNSRDSSTYAHWLSGTIYCARCGKNLGYNPYANKRYSRFRCVGNARGLCAPTNSIGVITAENLLRDALSDIINDKYVINVTEIIFQEKNADSKPQLQNTLARLETKLKRHKKAYAEEIDTLEEYRQNKLETLAEIEKVKHLIDETKKRNERTISKETISYFKRESNELLKYLFNDEYSIMQKNSALRTLIHHIVYDNKTDEFTLFFNC